MTSFCGSDNDENDYERGYRDGIKASEARVAEMEAALRQIADTNVAVTGTYRWMHLADARRDIARAALAKVPDENR